MIKLDSALLARLGLGRISADTSKILLETIYAELEMRVGYKLANAMSRRQLEEFERFIDASDEEGAYAWLQANFPDHRDVVASEFDLLCREISNARTDILYMAETIGSGQEPQR